MHVGVIGAGYVGIVTSAGLAELGHTVALHDMDAAKIALLQNGGLPLYEPGLLPLVERGVRAGRLSFSHDAAALQGCAVAIIAVGTHHVRAATASAVRLLDASGVIAIKSTAPAGTADALSLEYPDVAIATNPEFLREGQAVHDFFHPDRIVIGCEDAHAETALRELYFALDAPTIVTGMRTAEMIKYASNALLATKVSFANELASICAVAGVDVTTVLAGAGADHRIGAAYLNAGLGFGGSCLPKDLRALQQTAAGAAALTPLLDAVLAVNATQVTGIAERLAILLDGLRGRRIGLLGLAFKPDTDDVREAPSIALADRLIAAGALVIVHDPAALENARALLGTRVGYAPLDDPYAVADGADAVVLATEWDAYRALDFPRLRTAMTNALFFDARNACNPHAITAAGFTYEGVGRSA